ncbi:hypothetical protein SKAU_G00083920 [Synaphobranchus kaupii]|uniref:RIMS-binding protein 2 n=1 Tax=Synaphobranchus kaupii TaxID=118154 RepID=A0A9Q1FV14_SYNKA|nr:hypothetical protein SKAU_G00083920 [Synaphobranchus kaupii]
MGCNGKDRRDVLDLVRQLEDEASENERLKEAEEDYLRQKEQRLQALTQRNSALKEDQRLHAKLENLEQVLKHMRQVTERRQQLEQEHEQALAILTFKQNEVKQLQRAQFAAKKEQEGVVQMLESTLDCMQATVLELEEKCRSQSQQFSLLSHELERFRLQAEDSPDTEFCQLTNGVKEPEFTPLVSGLVGPPAHHHRVLPSINLKQGSTASAPRLRHLPPKSRPLLHHTHKPSPSYEVVAARESGTAPGKPKVFIVRHSYEPYDGPYHSPEVELPLKAGEYIFVYGDKDGDGFYEGELMDGRRGLVPSNFVELVSADHIMGLPHSSASDLSYNHQRPCRDRPERSDPPTPEEGVPGRGPSLLTNGFDADAEELAVDSVPYPRRLSLIKQLAKSIIIGWDPPLVPAGWGNVWSYNVFVDKELRLNVPFGSQTKAVLERLDVNLKAYRVSVQSVTERGDSESLRCTFLVGRDVCMAPTQLRAERVTANSAHLTWLPSNSNYMHTVSLNDGECWLVKAGGYSLSLGDLRPRQLYRAKVEARSHCTPWEISLYGREHKSAAVTFTTLASGPPAAPLSVQLDAGPSPGIALVSWLPVAVDAAGASNGVPVTGYAIYADKRKVLEVSSPTAGSVLMGPAQLHTLQTAQELTVRTMSPQGESTDSVPVPVLPNLMAITMGMTLTRPSGAAVLATSPPLDASAAKMSTLLHNPPADAHAPLAGECRGACRAIATDRASVLPPEVGLTLSSVAVQTLEAAVGTESLGMKFPPFAVSECQEHADSSAEPSHPSGPTPVSPQEVVPEKDLRHPADTHPQIPIHPYPSPLELETEDGRSKASAGVGSPGRPQLTPGPKKAESQDNSCLKKPQENQNGHCLSWVEMSSDLSNLLEEEEGLYSDNPGEEPYESAREDGKLESWETDSDEEILERILRAQVPINKDLFSIPEVTEEEDSCQETEEKELRRSPQIIPKHQPPGQGKPAVTISPNPCSTIPNSSVHCSTMANNPIHRSKAPDGPIYHSAIPNSTVNCSTMVNSPTHRSRTPDGPIYCSPILDSTTHCSTMVNSPTHRSKTSDGPIYCSPILDSTTHCSLIVNSPTHQSKTPNGPIYCSPILDSTTHCSTMVNSPTHRFRTPDGPIYCSPILNSTAHCSTMVNSPTHRSKTPDGPVYCSPIPDSTTNCYTMVNTPTHRSMTSDGPIYHSPILDSTAHCSLIVNSPTHQSKTPNGPIYCSPILDSPTHCSTMVNSPTHRSKTPDGPIYCSPILDSTTHCSTMMNSPTHRSKTPDGPIYCSPILDSTTHCSTMVNSPTHRSKTPDGPIYCSPIPGSTTNCYTMVNSPTHRSKTSDSPVYGSPIPDSTAHRSTKSNSLTHQSNIPYSPAYHSTILDDPAHSPIHRKVSFSSSHSIIPAGPTHRSAPIIQEKSSCAPASDRHFNTRHKCSEVPKHQHVSRDPSRGSPYEANDLSGYMTIPQPKSKTQHRVHYSDIVDTITYQRDEYDSDSSIYVSSKEARRPRQRSHKPLHQRGRPERSGDRLRREALLRSQRASDKQPLGHYLGGKTVVRTRAPLSSGIEIDVEYGTEDDDEGLPYDPAGVAVEQMSSKWWVEGGSSNVFEALRPKRQQSLRDLPFETEAADLQPGYHNKGAGLGTGRRGPTGAVDLAVWRQDYHTPSPHAKLHQTPSPHARLHHTPSPHARLHHTPSPHARLDHKARSCSTDSGSPKETLSHRGPQLSSKPGKTTRAEARQLKDGVRLASPECVEPEGPVCEDGARIFVALFPYDPAVMSPNPDTAEEELPFKEGQIIKVYGEKDQDGFYCGESGGRFGYVPCNMVSEIQVEDEVARAQLLQKGFLSPQSSIDNKDPSKPANLPQDLGPRRMVAIFDYDPRESSPNADIEAELSFSAGDVIYVFGDMDEDGFFYGDLKGHQGLVPSNFLQAESLPGDQATGGSERPQHQPEIPELRQQPQRQRRKSCNVQRHQYWIAQE